jgi:hypothetical protein
MDDTQKLPVFDESVGVDGRPVRWWSVSRAV